MSDLHLERVSDQDKERFLERLSKANYDAALITGDISTSNYITRHLREISEVCGDRKIYYLLGNHDYFHDSIRQVDRAVTDLSRCGEVFWGTRFARAEGGKIPARKAAA